MIGWQVLPLGQILTLQRGFDITRAHQTEGVVPVVSSSGINSYHCAAMVARPGVVIGRKGTLGTCFYINEPHWPHDTTLWVKDFKENEPLFCYYLLKNMDLAKYDVGAANPTLNRNHLHLLPAPCPPVEGQRRIAAILGAYDRLIEINRRRIAILQDMARALFDEWFVRFRFPGHEGHSIIEDVNGETPGGWGWSLLGDIATVNAGSIRPGTAPRQISYIDIASVSRGDVRAVQRLDFADAPGRARRKVRDGSIIWSMVRPNLRSYALIINPQEDVIASTGFAVLDSRSVPFSYLYQWVTDEKFIGYLTGNTTGAAYPAVTPPTFERAAILVPPQPLLVSFNLTAEPSLRLADTLRRTNVRLEAARDLLLLRLLSGDLNVTAVDREFEATA